MSVRDGTITTVFCGRQATQRSDWWIDYLVQTYRHGNFGRDLVALTKKRIT